MLTGSIWSQISDSEAGFVSEREVHALSGLVRQQLLQSEPFMTKSKLFAPLQVGGLKLENRIVIAPMCQYSAREGQMTDWHLMHLGHLALSGAAMLTIEATAIAPEGRITPFDVGLWDDRTEAAIGRVIDAVRSWSSIPIAIQLSHAGRKASADVPWRGGRHLPPHDPDGWQTVAPSALPLSVGGRTPVALHAESLEQIRQGFAQSARRAARLGVDAVQLHAAHGYLLHQFFSPISNKREDEYGGSLENRMRFPLEVFEGVRAAFPTDRPVTVRISGADWIDGGATIDDAVAFAQALEARGCSALNVSSGGIDPLQRISDGPNYQVPFARAVKQAVSIPVVAVGLITDYEQAEAIIATGDADLVALARGILYDPRWPWHAAAHLDGRVRAPDQYRRSQPYQYKNLFDYRSED